MEHKPAPKASRALRSMETSRVFSHGQQPEERVEARRGAVLPAERLVGGGKKGKEEERRKGGRD